MRKIDWNNVAEATDFPTPAPGGYLALITNVSDVEEKEYLRIEWDFAEGEFKGANRDTFHRAAFWPYPLIRSYKPTALGFFKRFKTALEKSNRGYTFDESNLDAMRQKVIGVILAQEEYRAKDGSIKTRLYVADTRSVEEIRAGKFTVPDLKKLPALPSGSSGGSVFTPIDNDSGPLPWDTQNPGEDGLPF